jgi:hypothetical protein
VSMACRVPYDVCSGCGNKARTRDEYCKEASCKFGGCDNNLTKLIKTGSDVHVLHVKNVSPSFFDISNVWRPADRTAFGGRADYVKAAADALGLGGVKMAADFEVSAPLSVVLAQDHLLPGEWSPYLAAQVKLAHGLAALESRGNPMPPGAARAFANRRPLDHDALGLSSPKAEKVAAALGALADRKVVIPIAEFAKMTKRAELAEVAAPRLAGVFGRMISDGTLERRVADNPYAPAEKLATEKERVAAVKVAADYSLNKTAVTERLTRSVVRGEPVPVLKTGFGNEKTAGDADPAEKLARDYAVYQLATLRRISEFDSEFPLTVRLSACQNQVI